LYGPAQLLHIIIAGDCQKYNILICNLQPDGFDNPQFFDRIVTVITVNIIYMDIEGII